MRSEKQNNTTMLRNMILGVAVAGLLASCNVKENKMLKARIDSLNVELQASEKTAQMLQEVGVMLDSIETNRLMLRSGVVEGTKYTDYSGRLNNLNAYIKETQGKLTELEESLKKSKASSSSYIGMVKKLKADLETSSQQVAALQQEVEQVRNENQTLARTVSQRDSLITNHTETIKVKEQDIASLEGKVEEINKNSINTQAEMYFAQGQALELAAHRTQFAPRKKKETKREALELYKRAYSLGKEDAKPRIDELEKDLS
jgi:chromosome segregation ATPase